MLVPIFTARDVLLLIYPCQPPLGALPKLCAVPVPNCPPVLSPLSIPTLPVPTEGLADTAMPSPPAWPRRGCATSRVPWLLPSPPERRRGHLPRAAAAGAAGHTGYRHPPPSPSPCEGSQGGGERANAVLPAQPRGNPVPLCQQGQQFGPWALPGLAGYSRHRRSGKAPRRGRQRQEQGTPKWVRPGGRGRRVPPGPPRTEEYLFIPSGAAPVGEASAQPWPEAFSARWGLRGGGAVTPWGGPATAWEPGTCPCSTLHGGGITVFLANQARAVPRGTRCRTVHPPACPRSPRRAAGTFGC